MIIKVKDGTVNETKARNQMHPSRRKIIDVMRGEATKDTFGWTPESENKENAEPVKEKFSILDQVKTPVFCPDCSKLMRRHDVKMWRRVGHCHDCQVELEHKLRVKGVFPLWERIKLFENEISILKENLEDFEEAYEKITPTSEFVTSEGHIQSFEFAGNIDEIKAGIKLNIDWIKETLPPAEKELDRMRTELDEKMK